MDSYHTHLSRVKKMFGGTSETRELAFAIARRIAPGSYLLLDVGCGDGTNTQHLMKELRRHGIDVVATGIELAELDRADIDGLNVVHQDFMKWGVDNRFDIVVATQSLYYFPRPRRSIDKMLLHTNSGGVCAITVWHRDCLLNYLNEELFHGHTAIDIASLVVEYLASHRLVSDIDTIHFEGVFHDDMISDPVYAESLINVISRTHASLFHCTEIDTTVDELRYALLNRKQPMTRKNVSVLGWKCR